MPFTETQLNVGRIQRFCLHDGPGIRSTVFLQGCGLHCWWCQNADLRPSDAAAARQVDAAALAEELLRDERYWRSSGGGVTLSGGEPLCQPEGCAALLAALGCRNVHRCVDTAGDAPAEALEMLVPHTDLWLFDLKTGSAAAYHDAAGGDLGRVLENLGSLVASAGVDLRLRIPLVAGFNTDDASLHALGECIRKSGGGRLVELVPGHDIRAEGRRSVAVTREECARAQEALLPYASAVEVCW